VEDSSKLSLKENKGILYPCERGALFK
jgi:hypothetical protein